MQEVCSYMGQCQQRELIGLGYDHSAVSKMGLSSEGL